MFCPNLNYLWAVQHGSMYHPQGVLSHSYTVIIQVMTSLMIQHQRQTKQALLHWLVSLTLSVLKQQRYSHQWIQGNEMWLDRTVFRFGGRVHVWLFCNGFHRNHPYTACGTIHVFSWWDFSIISNTEWSSPWCNMYTWLQQCILIWSRNV